MNVWMEGFETHSHIAQLSRKYASFSGNIVVQAGRVFGNSCGPNSIVMVTPSYGLDNLVTLGFGCRFGSHTTLVNSGNQGFYFESGLNEQCHVEFESNSGSGFRLHLKRGATTIASTAFYAFAVWHYFEVQVTVRDGTDGAWEIRHNGVLDTSGSGVNLAAAASDGADIFAIRFNTNLGSSDFLRLDDIYVNDGSGGINDDFLGPSIIEGIEVNANGDTIQWTNDAGSGSNFQNVDDSGGLTPDETGAGGTNSSDTNGQKDKYAFTDIQHITGTIHAVQLGAQMAMAAAGSRVVKFKFDDAVAGEVDGQNNSVVSTTYDEFIQTFDLNPADAAAWDVTDLDNGQFGVEVVS